MSNNNVINEKKKALLACKENILDEIKYYERSINDFCANHKNICYDDLSDSSDSEDDFPFAVETGPSISQLKQQQAMMKTCLHATQELTSLMVLQSEVDVLVEGPKLEGERPVTEPGIWREVTAECRIDLIPFTMTFFMHTPNRKFAPPSYRGLRVVPVKNSHEMELANSVLHTLKLPSDAVEVLRSYAAGYRSRRTTLARLANKYANTLFMEPHTEGGFVLKCADLLEVSWRLENKWSPVAPFHHRMKFDLEFMDESYIKIITQVHKKLTDPAIQTDERTLLLAQIISTCLEARGPIDESDLESKTTERDNDIDKRDSETEKRDSEVMAPPKSLPKKGKQKNKDSLSNAAQKRSLDGENGDGAAKKMKNDVPNDGAKKSVVDTSHNTRKSKMNDMVNEGGKKRKINEVNKAVSGKNVKNTDNAEDGNTKSKNVKKSDETEDQVDNTNQKPKNMKDPANIEDKTSAKTKNKVLKDAGDGVSKDINAKPTKLKEPANADSTKPKTKIVKDGTVENKDGNVRTTKEKNTKESNKNVKNTGSATKNEVVMEPIDVEKVKNKPKNMTTKEASNSENVDQNKNNAKNKTKPKNIHHVKDKENTDSNKIIKTDAECLKSKVTEKSTNDQNAENIDQNKNIVKIKNKPKNIPNVKSKEDIDSNQITKRDVERPKSHITDKTTNDQAEKAENIDQNKNSAKIKNKPKNIPNVKGKEDIDLDSNKITKRDAERPKSNITDKTTNDQAGTAENIDQNKNSAKIKYKPKNIPNVKSKEDIDSNKITKRDVERPKSNITDITDKMTNDQASNAKNIDQNKNNANIQNKPKNIPNVKSKEDIDSNKITKRDAERPKSYITDKTTNAAISKKNIQTKVSKIATETAKTKAKNVASTKNDDQAKKAAEKNIKNQEKLTEVADKGPEKTVKEKTVNSNDDQTVKKFTEKNATNIRNKDKISQITNKISEKSVKDKPATIKYLPEKKLSNNMITKKTKEISNNKIILKAPTKIITHKISSHRNSLKPQNPPKTFKAANTKIISTGNTEKENGGRGSKIPQKRLSPVSEGSSKKNLLRISPRKIPSKFKTSQETFKQKMVKSTNIPRLLKKPAPKMT